MGAQEFGDDLLRGLLEHTTRALDGVIGAGLLVTEQVEIHDRRRGGRGRGGRPAVPAVSTVLRVTCATGVAEHLDPAQSAAGVGPVWEAASEPGGPLVLEPSPADLDRWSALGPASPDELGVRGVLVLPGEPSPGGALMLVSAYLDRPPADGDAALLAEAGPLLARAHAMVEFATAEELKAGQMLQMIQYRRVIEQAKGLVLAAVGGDAPSAFTTLSRASQHFNVRLRNLAVALVEYVGDGPAEQPDDPDQVIQPGEADRHAAVQVWAALTARPVPPEAAAAPEPEPMPDPMSERMPEQMPEAMPEPMHQDR